MYGSKEDMHRAGGGFEGEHVAAQLHVTGHGLIVDVIGQVLGHGGRLFGEFLGVVGQ